MTILDEIAAKTIERVAEAKKQIPLDEMKAMALDMEMDTGFPFAKALREPGMSFICEVKKASPSKGLIVEAFPYLDIARDYEQAGASAISCLTEPHYFQGSNEYLKEIAKGVSIPVLRKDFTVDEYMIYEAKVLGASAVLLICAILSDEQLQEYVQLAHSLGLSALIEAHTAQEVERAMRSGGKIIGVNNRDLKTFTVDITTSVRLRELARKLAAEQLEVNQRNDAHMESEYIYISESGIQSPKDIEILSRNGTDAVLIGERLMRAPDKKAKLEELQSLI